MIEYVKGDVTEAPEAIIVHGCNTQGVMGSGVAKAVKAKWPHVFHAYKRTYEHCGLDVGGAVIVKIDDGRYVVNAITQDSYGRNKNVQYVEYDGVARALKIVARLAKSKGLISVALPKIGAGLGNGDWNVIEGIITKELNGLDVKVYEI